MKKFYATLVILFFIFTSCPVTPDTDNNDATLLSLSLGTINVTLGTPDSNFNSADAAELSIPVNDANNGVTVQIATSSNKATTAYSIMSPYDSIPIWMNPDSNVKLRFSKDDIFLIKVTSGNTKEILYYKFIITIIINIDEIAGSPKPQSQWGIMLDNFPNNLSNTITGNPKTSRTITWQSSKNTGGVIIGSNLYPSSASFNNGWYFHRVNITGLEPGKNYNFIAGSEGAYSPVYGFKTASDGSSFSILHITDTHVSKAAQPNATTWKRVVEKAVQKCPDAAFIVHTGDIVDDNIEESIPYYFDFAQTETASYAFFYSFGNNDQSDWYNQYFYTPQSTFGGILYSFDYGNAHFINIDSNRNLTSLQRAWLENDLMNSSKKWKVVMTHNSDYGRTDNDTALTKLFDKYNVDLVLAGHNHFYARSFPIDTAGNEKLNGTVYTIPNTASSKFNPVADQPFLAVDKQPNLPMFSEIIFTETNIYYYAYTVNNNNSYSLYDSYTMEKP